MREFLKIFLVNSHHVYPNVNGGDVDTATIRFCRGYEDSTDFNILATPNFAAVCNLISLKALLHFLSRSVSQIQSGDAL
jgi:hypothetical protein